MLGFHSHAMRFFFSFSLSPSLLLTSLKESFKPTNKKNIYFGRAGKGGEDKAIIREGRGNVGRMGGGEEGTYQNQGTFARCLFPPSGVCKLFFLCECACVEHLCVCGHVCPWV